MSATIEEKKEFHLCLDIAMEIMDLFESGGTPVEMGGLRGRELHIASITEVIKLHAPEHNITSEMEDAIGADLAETLGHYAFSTCAMWSVAHGLEHVLFPR